MGLFDSFKKGLQKTRNYLSGQINRLSASVGHFDEEMLDELEAILVQADVGALASMEIIDQIRDDIRASGDDSREAVLASMRKSMLAMLGEPGRLEIVDGQMTILLMVGVNGTGKTTTAGKLCARFKADGKKVIMGAADTFRAAAIEQLTVWGERTGTTVISHQEGSDPAAVVFDAIQSAKAKNADVLILDTAGRLHNKQNLMDELSKIRRIISREAPDAKCETLLVIDATTGQNAVNQARVFREAANVTGLIITKLDGNSKGGVAIAVSHESQTPIMLAGLGEKLEDLTDFDPVSFVDSLLPDREV